MSVERQLMSDVLITENLLPLTVDLMVDSQFKCIQQLQLLILHLEIEGYIPGLLNGSLYLRKMGDLIGESLILR